MAIMSDCCQTGVLVEGKSKKQVDWKKSAVAHDNVKSSWGKTKESNFSPLRHLMVYGAWVEWQISKRIMLQNDSQLVLNIRIFVNSPKSTSYL